MLKSVSILLFCLVATAAVAQPPNNLCINAEPIFLDANGEACVTGTTIGATTSGEIQNNLPCKPNAKKEVWFQFIAVGAQNTATVIPNGGTPIQQPIVTIRDNPCGEQVSDECGQFDGTSAETSRGYGAGDPVWVDVASALQTGGDGTFQLCIASKNPPPTPGNTCDGAEILCDKSAFTVDDLSGQTSSGLKPTCFGQVTARDVWYKFTIGKAGLMEFTIEPHEDPANPGVGLELDWAMYDITDACPINGNVPDITSKELVCNFNYSGPGNYDPVGLKLDTCDNGATILPCPKSNVTNTSCQEFCPAITVGAADIGKTYAILIDNFDGNNTGFDFEWGGDFEIAPTAIFDAAPVEGCDQVTVTITDASIATVDWLYQSTAGNPGTFTHQDNVNVPPIPPPPFTMTYTDPGTHLISLTTTSATGCTDVQSVAVVVNEVTADVTKTDANCNAADGTATATPTFGTDPYTYQWDANAGGQTTQTATDLASGTYDVTITDGKGCMTTESVTIDNVGSMNAALVQFTDVVCNNGCDGTAEISVSGGVTPYTFTLDGNPIPAGDDGLNYSNLCVGTHTVEVSDPNGCQTSIDIPIAEPPPITVNTNTTSSTCGQADGSATATASGGTAPLTYQWNAAANNQSTATASNLTAGPYQVTVTDGNGCTEVVDVVVNDQSDLSISMGKTDALCGQPTGTASVTPSGGSSPYTITWDANAGGQTTNTATNLLGGVTYSVTVNDANGCTKVGQINVDDIYNIEVSATADPSLCSQPNGEGHATVSVGTAPYVYQWIEMPSLNPVAGGNVQDITTLPAGDYAVVVVDADLCADTALITVPDIYNIDVAATDVDSKCGGANGEGHATVNVGTAPYVFQWFSAPPALVPYGNTADVDTLLAGNYIVVVQDADGCIDTTNILVDDINTLAGTASSTPVSCVDATNGTVTANPTGGDEPYTYVWDDPLGQTTQTATDLIEDDYMVTITDAFGCVVTATASVGVDPGAVFADFEINPEVTTIEKPVIDFIDKSSGAVTWHWDFGTGVVGDTSNLQNPQFEYPVGDGDTVAIYTITLTITDGGGCSSVATGTVTIKPLTTFFVPNAFTPDGDDRNDRFYAYGISVEEFEMWIYDRWGLLIYRLDDITKGWPGTKQGSNVPAQEDTYVYVVKMTDVNDKDHKFIGHVTLIR